MGEAIDAPPKRQTRLLKAALQLSLVAVFVLLIVHFLNVYSADISSIWLLSPLDLLLIGIWSFVSYSAYAYAVYAMLIHAGLKGVSPFGWLRIYFVSRVANFLVIQGGNVFRLILLKKKYNFSYTNSLGITVFLVWVNALIALLASLFFLIGNEKNVVAVGLDLSSWVLLFSLTLLTGPVLVVRLINRYRTAAFWNFRVPQLIANVSIYFTDITKDSTLIGKTISLSSIHFFFFAGVNYFCFHAIGYPIGIAETCFFTTAFVFTRYINIVPGNLGLSELVGGLISEHLGIGFGNGLVVTGIVRIVELLMILLLSLMYGKFVAFKYFSD